MKKGSPKIIKMKQNKFDQFLAKLAIFISILMIAGGAIGMILVQKDLRKSQDLRQQASVSDGKVSVTMSATKLTPNQQGKINFYINTAGVQTDGVQLTFNVVTDTLPNPPAFTLLDSAPLQLAYSEIEDTADGYLVSVIAIPKQLGQPFSSTSALHFASLNFAPTKPGSIALNFDVENSISTVHASNPPADELTHIATNNFSVTTPQSTCTTDTDCPNGEICYQPPMPICPPGMACIQVMPGKVCQAPDASPAVSPSPDACTRDNAGNVVCPMYDLMPNFCQDGLIIAGIVNDCGCQGPPRCEYPEVSPSPSPAITYCSANNDCQTGYVCAGTPPGGCGTGPNGEQLTCATQPYCRLAEGMSCTNDDGCYSGYECTNGSCTNTTIVSVSPTPAVSPTPTDDPGIGGNPDIATCNESCAVNDDCDVNLRCYSGQCRLVTNVSSESCSNPTDQGLSFACNEYCADTNECAGDLICHNNNCRNPENVDSRTCFNLTAAQRTSVARSCNESCSSNNDCDANLRCYQGACRLATNPGSYSCSASTKKTVSSSVYGATSKPKGSDDGSSEGTETGKKDPSKTTGSITIDPEDKDMLDPADTDKMGIADGKSQDGEEETALDSVKSYFLANPKLPVTLMGIGLGLVVAILLLSLLKRRKKNNEPPTPPMSGGMGAGTTNKYESNLQNKINSLKKESLQPPKPGSIPPAMTPPVGGLNKIEVPQNKPVQSESAEVFSGAGKSSSMLNKIKNKDITPPSV
jgi:hypothetical protein